jgi:hypothetical protein
MDHLSYATRVQCEGCNLTIKLKEISGHQDLETELDGNIHIRNILLLTVLVPVVEVFDNLLQYLGPSSVLTRSTQDGRITLDKKG